LVKRTKPFVGLVILTAGSLTGDIVAVAAARAADAFLEMGEARERLGMTSKSKKMLEKTMSRPIGLRGPGEGNCFIAGSLLAEETTQLHR